MSDAACDCAQHIGGNYIFCPVHGAEIRARIEAKLLGDARGTEAGTIDPEEANRLRNLLDAGAKTLERMEKREQQSMRDWAAIRSELAEAHASLSRLQAERDNAVIARDLNHERAERLQAERDAAALEHDRHALQERADRLGLRALLAERTAERDAALKERDEAKWIRAWAKELIEVHTECFHRKTVCAAERALLDRLAALEAVAVAARDVRNRLQLSKQGSWRGDDAFPSHSHDIDGVWDASNGPPDGGTLCADCAAWKTLGAALDALRGAP